ncbi:hypothetical protein J1N35_044114 [Gossypium stocksii]|uniref:Uncharacterized protein n=1 Tax=Gossypium stocksii TaxID=47602 RepID=A0A9D3ZFQ0_9ROSI|nr:hypothetical protein J1N35_044114 [Gossypium stocksii]
MSSHPENQKEEATVGFIFETRQKIGMRFDRNVSIIDMKENVSEKISRRCGRKMTKLFYKFPVLSNPIKFTEMELLDDDESRQWSHYIARQGGLHIHPVVIETDVLGEDGSDNNGSSDHEYKDFSDPNLDNVLDDIDDGGPDDGNDHAPLIENSSCGIIIRNDPGAHMSIVDLDAVHASEFLEYPDINMFT